MIEKIVILGSNSFSGAHFADCALSEGFQVIGMSRSPEPVAAFLPYLKNKNVEKFKFLRLDLNHDLNDVIIAIEDIQPAFVVNFAAQGMVAESWQYPEHWFQTNSLSQIKLHDRRGE